MGLFHKHHKIRKKPLNTLLNLLILIAVIFNVCIFLSKTFYPAQIIPKIPSHINPFLGATPINIPFYDDQANQNYNDSSLEEDIAFLNLPTWSRSYVSCKNSKSEIKCPQIAHAAELFRNWVKSVESCKNESLEKCKYILARHYFDGLGNRISIDIYLFLVAVMSNRCLVIEGRFPQNGRDSNGGGNAFDYQSSVMHKNDTIAAILQEPRMNPPIFLQVFDGWWDSDYKRYFKMANYMDLDRLIYSSMIYTHNELYDFCMKHFGIHAVYFLSNFLVRIPDANMKVVNSIFDKVPKSLNIFGVHLRFHKAGEYFAYSVDQTISTVTPFLQNIAHRKPTIFALASDSEELIRVFRSIFNDTITTDSIKRSDFDHVTALTDIAFLMMSNQCLLTYRSTFSFTIASRMGKRAYFYEKESPGIFQAGNSQATAVSMIYHQWDFNDWQTSRRFRLKPQHEQAIRYFFRYLAI